MFLRRLEGGSWGFMVTWNHVSSHTDIPTSRLHYIYSHMYIYITCMHRVKVLFVSLWCYLLFFLSESPRPFSPSCWRWCTRREQIRGGWWPSRVSSFHHDILEEILWNILEYLGEFFGDMSDMGRHLLGRCHLCHFWSQLFCRMLRAKCQHSGGKEAGCRNP